MVTETEEKTSIRIVIPKPHAGGQDEFVRCIALRQIAKCGRRWGKTEGVAIKGLCAFLGRCNACLGEGCSECDNTGKVRRKRVLYAAPTAEQVTKFWFEVTKALAPAIEAGILKKDETEKIIEFPKTEMRIKAKTAWNANTLRGDFADLLLLDEYRLMNEDAWTEVGHPMLLDNNGTAIFIFTPSSLKSEGVSKAKDPMHASKLFNKYKDDTSGRWQTFHYTSYDNPCLSKIALQELTETNEMSRDTLRREILAEDDEFELSWLVYGKFQEDTCKIPRFTIPETWPLVVGHDFGSANPAALFVAKVLLPIPEGSPKHLRYGDYVAFKEYAPGGGFSTAQHAQKFKEIAGKNKVEIAVGGNITTEEEIRGAYGVQGWSIAAPALTRVNAQIDRVHAIMEQNKLYIFEDLYQLLSQIVGCMWELDNENKPMNKIKDENKYHALACLRYLATYLPVDRPIIKREGRKVRIF